MWLQDEELQALLTESLDALSSGETTLQNKRQSMAFAVEEETK